MVLPGDHELCQYINYQVVSNATGFADQCNHTLLVYSNSRRIFDVFSNTRENAESQLLRIASCKIPTITDTFVHAIYL